jgi:hypothetical protein
MARRLARLLLTCFLTSPFTPPVAAADLTKIDRRIAREPAYRSRAPKYCLLVFGPETKTRVWLVVDGDRLYVDRNGNGDLTEKGESFRLRASPAGAFPRYLECEVGDIAEAGSGRRHRRLQVLWRGPEQVSVSVRAAFADPKLTGLRGAALLAFADRPQNAPIVHFGGGLTLRLSMATSDGLPSSLCARVGTPGVGRDSFADYSGAVLRRTRALPEVQVVYPGDKGRVREKGKLEWNG